MSTNNRLTVLYSPLSNAASFVVEGVCCADIEILPLNLRTWKVAKVLYHVFARLKLYKIAALFHYSNSTIQRLWNIKNKVLCFDCCRLNDYSVLNSLIKVDDKSVFFWNPLDNWSRNNKKFIIDQLQKLREMGYVLFSFDVRDCEEFKLVKLKNVNRRIPIKKSSCFLHDFYFIGLPKREREGEVLRLKEELERRGFKTEFKIIRSKKEYVPLLDNIRYSNESKCIVDWVAANQTGLTLRPFDALFLHTKLLTNCQNIVNQDFYNPSNIFVIKDSLDGIEDFMSRPYVDIPESIVSQYEINSWLKINFLDLV